MRHLGILAHSTEGAALCFLAFCQEGFRELGEHINSVAFIGYTLLAGHVSWLPR